MPGKEMTIYISFGKRSVNLRLIEDIVYVHTSQIIKLRVIDTDGNKYILEGGKAYNAFVKIAAYRNKCGVFYPPGTPEEEKSLCPGMVRA